MKSKKKTTGANCGLNNYLNQKLSVVEYNTPTQIGQDYFAQMRGIFTENQQKENQCYHCLKWFEWLPFGAVDTGELRGVYVGVCADCINSLSILPPALQGKFWQKVRKNLKASLGGNFDA